MSLLNGPWYLKNNVKTDGQENIPEFVYLYLYKRLYRPGPQVIKLFLY